MTDTQHVVALLAAANPYAAVPIHAIHLAGELTERDRDGQDAMGMQARDFMRELAARHGGRFAEAR